MASTTSAVAGVVLRPLILIDETRYIDVAWEMRVTGDFGAAQELRDLHRQAVPMLSAR